MKAKWNGKVIAESDSTLVIEGNHYFPPNTVKSEFFSKSDMQTNCPWKGDASYYDIDVDGQKNKDGAWYYPAPKEGSIKKAGGDFTNYIAFWRGIEVTE